MNVCFIHLGQCNKLSSHEVDEVNLLAYLHIWQTQSRYFCPPDEFKPNSQCYSSSLIAANYEEKYVPFKLLNDPLYLLARGQLCQSAIWCLDVVDNIQPPNVALHSPFFPLLPPC